MGKAAARAAAGRRWTGGEATRFFAVLAERFDVAAASAAVGRSVEDIFARRAADEAFRARWDRVLAEAYDRIEAQLVAAMMPGAEPAATKFEAERALKLLAQRGRMAGGAALSTTTLEEAEAALLRKLRALAARRAWRIARAMAQDGEAR